MLNKKLMLASAILFSFMLVSTLVRADTGTYVIEKQFVNLTVQTDTNVIIDYLVKFRVTGGNIPWVKIGLPNSNFDVQSFGESASNVYADNEGGWSGVYVSLDRTYYGGESFEFTFRALQHNFIYRYNDNASIQFTPVWWDNAVTEDLMVSVIVPPEIRAVQTSSEPTRYENNTVIWEWNNVEQGGQRTVGVLMPLEVFPALQSQPSQPSSPSEPTQPSIPLPSVPPASFLGSTGMWILIFVVITVGIVVVVASHGSLYKGPLLSFGGEEESVRHLNMNCPNDDAPLDKREIKKVTIDFCDKCGGCFFDKGEVESLMQAGANEADMNTKGNSFTNIVADRKGKCPRCEGTMRKKVKTHKDTKTTNTIYVCDKCGGIWMDKGTYQSIKNIREKQERMQQERMQQERIDKIKAIKAGGEEAKKSLTEEEEKEYHGTSYYPIWWWYYYPYISCTGRYSRMCFAHHTAVVNQGGYTSSSSGSSCVASGCACVACACVASCACACACAGGSAAGCSPKNKYPQIKLNTKRNEDMTSLIWTDKDDNNKR